METDPTEAAEFRMMVELEERGLFHTAFHTPVVAIFAWDAVSGQFVAANAAAQTASGYSLRQLSKRHISDMVGPLPPKRLHRIVARLKRRRDQTVVFRLRHRDADGRFETSRIYLKYVSHKRATLVAHVQNVTRYQEARCAAQAAETALRTAIEALPDGFVLYDADDRLVICNQRYREIYASSAQVMRQGVTFREILQFGLKNGQYAEAIGREEDWLAERMAAHAELDGAVEQHLSDGQWLRIVERPIAGGGRVGLRIDITELKNNQALLEQYARTDYLTGLLNRRGLNERIGQLGQTLQSGERIAVFHVDLDKFKSINDAQGHDAGDFVLQHCAKILSDGSNDPQCVARVGGDEFIVLQKTRHDDKTVLAHAQGLIDTIAQPVTFRDRVCNISACIGIAFVDALHLENTRTALSAADLALNDARKAGCGSCRIFQTDMRQQAVAFIQMAQQIRTGLHRAEFEPFFQPQVNAVTQKIIGFEALIRWQHPKNGLVPAGKFLTTAERAGLMDSLDNIVMDRSCFALGQMLGWGLKNPKISINMSTTQLRDPNIGNRLLRYCDAYRIAPVNLRIELLESTLLDDRSDMIITNVHMLIGLGFDVELDDFGTGHAAIATLRQFSVSRIKIDRSLVENIDHDSGLQVITGAIIGLAGQLDVKVLAEGVETNAEQATLINLGCDCAQGYFHARPMPLLQLPAWIEGRDAA